MIIQKQSDSRWAGIRLGTCGVTIGSDGCAATCLSIMLDSTPDWINKVLKEQGGYINGCLMNWAKSASIWGMEYSAITSKPLFYPCIANVDFNSRTPAIEQHFVILLDEDTMIDPWLGQEGTPYFYKIINYRNIRPKQQIKQGDIMWWEKLPDNNTIWAYNNFKGIITAKPYSGTNAWADFVADKGTMNQVRTVNRLTETTIDQINASNVKEITDLRKQVSELIIKADNWEIQFNKAESDHKTSMETLKINHKNELEKQRIEYESKIANLTSGIGFWQKLFNFFTGWKTK